MARKRFCISHKSKADPLHAKLGNSQQACQALKCFDMLAASDIPSRRFRGEDVSETCRGRGGAKENKVGRDALRSSAADDSVVLW